MKANQFKVSNKNKKAYQNLRLRQRDAINKNKNNKKLHFFYLTNIGNLRKFFIC